MAISRVTKVVDMFSSFWLLRVESRDFSQAEKEKTACKAEQIHKMTTIFNHNGPRLLGWSSEFRLPTKKGCSTYVMYVKLAF